jgi:membrane protein DedA with SNARE-associated domain
MQTQAAYLAAALGPFVQEDAAIFAAAASALAMPDARAGLFVTVWLGLCASDVWKYGIGRLAHAHGWARKQAQKPPVQALAETVTRRIGFAMMAARFIPGTRIPLYLAAGWFKVPFWRFLGWMMASALAYVSLAFAIFQVLGALAGPQFVARAGLGVALVMIAIAGAFWALARMRPRRSTGP